MPQTYDELTDDNQKRMLALSPLTIDLTPPRVQHLTEQVFNETYATLEEWEYAWQEKVSEILDVVEPEVAKQKLTAGKSQLAGQLSLV